MPHPPGRGRSLDPVAFSLFATKVVVVLVVLLSVLGEVPRIVYLAPAVLACATAGLAGYSVLRSRRRVEALQERYRVSE